MADEATILLDLTIAGRRFPLELAPNEQQSILELADQVNKSVEEFQKAYPSKDKLDCVIMAFLKSHNDIINAHQISGAAIEQHISTLEHLLLKGS
jgi:cell division protein ZapA (FtsZ GTPase activity inhibitor)